MGPPSGDTQLAQIQPIEADYGGEEFDEVFSGPVSVTTDRPAVSGEAISFMPLSACLNLYRARDLGVEEEAVVPVRVTGQEREIANAIDNFPPDYHADFWEVRAIGRRYVGAAAPADDVVAELSRALRDVLRRWGAGKRGAPELRGPVEFEDVLCQAETHASLASLGRVSLSALNSLHGRRFMNGKVAAPEELATFESDLFDALHILGERLFVRNTNATYPMKAVLLITGLMPAFDSQVRSGLQRGGFMGMDKTQYLLPTGATRADGRKIARLPFLLGECWAACTRQLHEGIENSKFRGLVAEPGRVFDVLLFMQANEKNPVLVTYDPPGQAWYDLG